ncbi:MAG: hypothetical protein WC718_02955 [Phycisphaerales bacterium]|jgi:hypothetical protein
MLLLTSLAPTALMVSSAASLAAVYSILPDSQLAKLLRYGVGRYFQLAVAEAETRASGLSTSQASMRSLARAALARQASTMPWDTRLGSIIERAYDAGAINAQDGMTYFHQGLELSVTPIEGITPGQASCQIKISRTRMGPESPGSFASGYSSTQLRDPSVVLKLCAAFVDGVPVFPYRNDDPRSAGNAWSNRIPMSGGAVLSSTATSTVFTVDAPLVDGNATVTMECDLIAGDSSRPVNLAARVPLVAAVPDIIEPVTDSETEEKLRNAFEIHIRRFWSRVGPDGSVPTEITIDYFPRRMPVQARLGFWLNRDFLNRKNGYFYFSQAQECVWPQTFTPGSKLSCLRATFMMDPTWTAETTDITLIGRRDALSCFPTQVTECIQAGMKLPVWVGPVTIPNVPVQDLPPRKKPATAVP